MNSEDLKRFAAVMTPSQQYEQERRDAMERQDTKTIAEGETVATFISHPGWIILRREIEGVIDTLVTKLINCHGTIRERERLQMEIRMLKEFIKRPDKYVENLKQLHRKKLRK